MHPCSLFISTSEPFRQHHRHICSDCADSHFNLVTEWERARAQAQSGWIMVNSFTPFSFSELKIYYEMMSWQFIWICKDSILYLYVSFFICCSRNRLVWGFYDELVVYCNLHDMPGCLRDLFYDLFVIFILL